MPVIIVLAVRSLIQMAVTLGIITLAEKYVLPIINQGIEEIIKAFGVSEEEAKDIVSNEVVQFAEQVGIGALTLRAKIPTKIAERLGFTSKGFAKRTLSTKAQSAVSRAAPAAAAAVGIAPVLAASEAAAVVANAQTKISGFKIAYDIAFKTLGLGFLGGMVIANWIDFGNWNSGAYQKKMQSLLKIITFGLLTPDKDSRQSLTLSSDVFQKVYNTYRLEGAVGINDPFKLGSAPFTRENLLDLTDKIGAELLRTTGKASTKEVLIATQTMLVFSAESLQAPAAAPAAAGAAPAQVKVFTGVVSQGTLGAAEPFSPREDDLIDSIEDLKTAANNNLVSFLKSLAGRIVYELKIVGSVIMKDGTKRIGSVQKVPSGQTKDGKPLFKTVKNKFAVIDIFAWTAKNVRSKIETIILGPVDSAKLQPAGAILNDLSAQFQSSITTTNINEIKAIETTQPLTVTPPTTTPPSAEPFPPPPPAAPAPPATAPPAAVPPAPPPTPSTIQHPAPAAPAPPPTPSFTIPPSNNPNKCQAQSISEYFDVNRVNFPRVEERSKWYEAWGLGPAAWYTGTAEQNTKLLTELKRRQGC